MSTPVLDHGYVSLVETWGSDESIVEAARMSTGKGFQGWDKDEKFLKFLYDNKHSTPFEMAGAIFEIKAPIFIFREWHRHRSQCLAGDTLITLVSPRGTTFKRTIKEIFDLKYGGVVDASPIFHKNGKSKAGNPVLRPARRKDNWRVRILPNCQDRLLRVLDEATGHFLVANMKDVWESGTKEVFAVKAGNYEVVASAKHPFFTQRGWVKTKDLIIGDRIARMGKVASEERPIPPSLRSGIGVWTTMMRSRMIGEIGICYKCEQMFTKAELELDHVVPVKDNLKLALDESNLKPICISCHLEKSATEQCERKDKSRRGVRWEKVELLPTSRGMQPTYDIEVEGDHHNYCANDLVVHNSYNEMSARYVPLPDENYVPSEDRIASALIKARLSSNKQEQSVDGTTHLISKFEISTLRERIECSYSDSEASYQDMLMKGLPKELARLVLPVGRYSKMRAGANLRNWLAFLTLRQAPNAQWEIQQYANAVADLLTEKFPKTMELFNA